jgi:hypothetical protein
MGGKIESEGLSKSSEKIDNVLSASLVKANEFAFLGSTLSKSDQELKLSPLLAEFPRLPHADAASFEQYTQNDMAKISIAILQEWAKALAEAAELVEKEIGSIHENTHKTELVEKYAWLNSLGGLVSALIHMDTVGAQGITHIDGVDKLNPLATLVPQFLMLAIADSAHFQGGALVGAASAIDGLHSESKVFQGAWRAITNHDNDRSTLIAGWVSSLWGVGLIYQLSVDSMKIDEVEKQRDKQTDINFAKTYAETLLGIVCSGQFSTFIEAALASATGKSTDQGGDTHSLISKAKLALLSIALALLLKLEEGTTSELSFSGLLKGEVDLTKNDPYDTASLKRALLDEIHLILAALEPDERDLILYSLLGYMSTNPAIEEMLDQQKVFKNVLNNNPLEKELIAQRPLSA